MQIVVVGCVLAAAIPASAAGSSLECAPRPDSPTGYQVNAVGADSLEAPPTTPAVAVLDSGVAAVPELSGRLREGVNVVTGGRNASDLVGHGTAVASVAAAAAGGVRGVSPTTPVVPIKIFNPRGQAAAVDVINGIRAAVRLGARVINISAALPARGSDNQANRRVQDAIWAAVTKRVVVVAPTGNEGGKTLDIPAAYAHVLAVAATDEGNARADFSNAGAGVDLAAPGSNITTAVPSFLCSTGYALVSGTSFAAPAVAGAAALVLQRHPELDATQAADLLRLRGLRAPAPGWNIDTGFGVLDVPASLAAPVPPPDDPEVNDTVTWAKKHPFVLAPPARKRTVAGRLAPHMDPRDFFRLRLVRGDKFRVRVAAPGAAVALTLNDGQRDIARGGSISLGVPRTGAYYIGASLRNGPAAGADYELRLER